MFGKLKDRLKSWLGTEEEKPSKTKKKTKEKKPVKKEAKKSKPKPIKKSKRQKLPSDKQLKEISEKIPDSSTIKDYQQDATKLASEDLGFQLDKVEEIKKQVEEKGSKPSFFSKLFKKKAEEVEQEIKAEELTAPIEEHEENKDKEEKKKSFFSKLTSKLTSSKITESDFDDIFQDLEIILLENNVALDVVDKIREDLKKAIIGKDVKHSELEKTIVSSLKESISSVLTEPPNLIQKIKDSDKPYTIIFFGVNGTGKTTSIAKLASKLKENNVSCVLAAADTFRAAAIQQLETHAERLKIPIIKHDYGSDPTAVAFDAKKYAEIHKTKCVLIDTAGRMYTKDNLIKQMEKIIRVIQPDLKIFVGESTTGNDAISQIETFNDAIGIDGIILSKADVDEKGGTALSVSYVTKKPIYFLGTGQQYKDLQDFNKSIILKNLGLD